MQWSDTVEAGVRIARARGATLQDAEDATGQACLNIYRLYREPPSFALLAVVVHRCLYEIWRSRRYEAFLPERITVRSAEEEAIPRLELQATWSVLPQEARRLVWGERTRTNRERMYLHRLRKQLREKLYA